eukprot:s4791_g1.t1
MFTRPGGRGTYAQPGEQARPPLKPRLPGPATARPKGPPSGPQPPSVGAPVRGMSDAGLKRKVSGGVVLPSAKAPNAGNAVGKGTAKAGGVSPPPEPPGKGAGQKGTATTDDSEAWAAKKTMARAFFKTAKYCHLSHAKPAPAEARETPAAGQPRPAKFQPAFKSKPPEPATEPPNGKGKDFGKDFGKESKPAQKAAVPPTQKGVQKGTQKGAGKSVAKRAMASPEWNSLMTEGFELLEQLKCSFLELPDNPVLMLLDVDLTVGSSMNEMERVQEDCQMRNPAQLRNGLCVDSWLGGSMDRSISSVD